MSDRLYPIEPLTKAQRRWFSLLPKDEMDRNFAFGLLFAGGTGLFLGGLLGLTLAGWLGGVALMGVGLPVMVLIGLLARFAQVHGHTVGSYSWSFFDSTTHPKQANAAIRALAEDDFELARDIGQQYWATADNQDRRAEARLRGQLLELHEALKERQRLEAQVSGRGDLVSKLAQVREFNDDVRKLLQKEV